MKNLQKKNLFVLPLVLSVLLCVPTSSRAQFRLFGERERIMQFSGVVVSGVTGEPVPFTTVYNTSHRHGSIADASGFFSFVAVSGDSIRFSSIGYQNRLLVIPDTLSTDAYSVVVPLEQDTVTLLETVIYPWPSKDRFRDAFVNLELPESDADIIQRNFNLAAMREQARNGKMNADMNYNSLMQQQSQRLYYQNQQVPNNLLNPFAWAKFIKQLQRKKKADKLEEQSKGYQEYNSETDYDYSE